MRYVYLVRAGESQYKVGIASNIVSRVRALQTSNANLIEVITAKQLADANLVERHIHKQLHEMKLNGGKEWFKLTPEQAIDIAVLINKGSGIDRSEIMILKDLIEEQNLRQQKINAAMRYLVESVSLENTKAIVKPSESKPDKAVLAQENTIKREQEKAIGFDAIVENALQIFRNEGKASTSLLQRRLSIGYARAARVIDQLEAEHIISPADGARPRVYLGYKHDTIST